MFHLYFIGSPSKSLGSLWVGFGALYVLPTLMVHASRVIRLGMRIEDGFSIEGIVEMML